MIENPNKKPKCVIITGRAGAGKTTLSKKLAKEMWMPVISRDEIKEGYINTFGIKCDQLPPETNGLVTDLFFDVVFQLLSGKVSIIIEAAFQHSVWEWRMPKILELSNAIFVICSIDADIAGQRHLQRGLDKPKRVFYHEDKRVLHYLATGEIGTPKTYIAPKFNLPTIEVSTDGEYVPSLDEVVKQIHSMI